MCNVAPSFYFILFLYFMFTVHCTLSTNKYKLIIHTSALVFIPDQQQYQYNNMTYLRIFCNMHGDLRHFMYVITVGFLKRNC